MWICEKLEENNMLAQNSQVKLTRRIIILNEKKSSYFYDHIDDLK